MKKKELKQLHQFMEEAVTSLTQVQKTLADQAWGAQTLEDSIQLQLAFSKLNHINEVMQHNKEELKSQLGE